MHDFPAILSISKNHCFSARERRRLSILLHVQFTLTCDPGNIARRTGGSPVEDVVRAFEELRIALGMSAEILGRGVLGSAAFQDDHIRVQLRAGQREIARGQGYEKSLDHGSRRAGGRRYVELRARLLGCNEPGEKQECGQCCLAIHGYTSVSSAGEGVSRSALR